MLSVFFLRLCSQACFVHFVTAHHTSTDCDGCTTWVTGQFPTPGHERELRPCIRQTQTYPHIFFSSGLSRTKCPLGDFPISHYALVPLEFPLAGKVR